MDNKCFYCLENSKNSCSSCNLVEFCSTEHLKCHKSESGDCLPFKIEYNQVYGKYCIATKDVKPFEIVLEDTATTWGTYDDSEPLCLSCLKVADLNVKCEFCNLPMCKSNECLNSPTHFPECQILRKHQPKKLEITANHPVYALIAPLRVLHKKNSLLEDDLNAFEQIMKLESHIAELQQGYFDSCTIQLSI